ncbi:MAG: EAL domain-containing protein [Sulfurimonas sp.]
MKKRSLKHKIFLAIFYIPIIAPLLYFSYGTVADDYSQVKYNSAYRLSSDITGSLADFIHQLQKERGLGAGHLAVKNETAYRDKFTLQFAYTDKAYRQFVKIATSDSEEKRKLKALLVYRVKPIATQLLQDLEKLHTVRQQVLNVSISIQDEVKYYANINQKLIAIIEIFNSVFTHTQSDTRTIIELQKLKESTGAERAYMYYYLSQHSIDKKILMQLENIRVKQQKGLEAFFIHASSRSIAMYDRHYGTDMEKRLKRCRTDILDAALPDRGKAEKCFNISTAYIDIFAKVTTQILDKHREDVDTAYRTALQSLYTTVFLWLVSIAALFFLAYILKKMIEKEETYLQELRIAGYAFDAQEVMVITNTDGTIIKVNEAFTKVTGYKASEAVGQTPNILKSFRHDDDFYHRMWVELINIGRWKGEIYNKRKNGKIYPALLSITAIKDAEGQTAHYIAHSQDITAIKKAQEDAQYQADHDFLTGFLNRKSLTQKLYEEFSKAKRHHFLHAFLYIDIDNFKKINDYYGHHIGDLLLVEISKRLKSIMREDDIIGRLGGDEFGIILLNLDKEKSETAKCIKKITAKIFKSIARTFIINKYQIEASLSIGIKLFPGNEDDKNDVIIHADTAMYKAKAQGKNQFVFFDQKIENELKHYTILEKEIKNGLENREFTFFFQPKINTESGKIHGAELLIRWRHPEKGLLYPGSFITVAQETGMMHRITMLAIHAACKCLKSYSSLFGGTLAINISAKELLQQNFEGELISTVLGYNVPPSRIELEITEEEIIKDFDSGVIKMRNLQKFGFKFSIDDFGTGYSSITYLQKLPADHLKIDKSFFDDLSLDSNKKLIEMIISMAKTFNMGTISEGIESEQQLAFIKACGSDQYQGFYFSEAVDEKRFVALLTPSLSGIPKNRDHVKADGEKNKEE